MAKKLDVRTIVGAICTVLGAATLIILFAFESHIIPALVVGAILLAIGLFLASDAFRRR